MSSYHFLTSFLLWLSGIDRVKVESVNIILRRNSVKSDKNNIQKYLDCKLWTHGICMCFIPYVSHYTLSYWKTISDSYVFGSFMVDSRSNNSQVHFVLTDLSSAECNTDYPNSTESPPSSLESPSTPSSSTYLIFPVPDFVTTGGRISIVFRSYVLPSFFYEKEFL